MKRPVYTCSITSLNAVVLPKLQNDPVFLPYILCLINLCYQNKDSSHQLCRPGPTDTLKSIDYSQ